MVKRRSLDATRAVHRVLTWKNIMQGNKYRCRNDGKTLMSLRPEIPSMSPNIVDVHVHEKQQQTVWHRGLKTIISPRKIVAERFKKNNNLAKKNLFSASPRTAWKDYLTSAPHSHVPGKCWALCCLWNMCAPESCQQGIRKQFSLFLFVHAFRPADWTIYLCRWWEKRTEKWVIYFFYFKDIFILKK